VSADLVRSPEALARRVAESLPCAVALGLTGVAVPTEEEAEALRHFVDELQLRGVSVVLHGVSGGFLTAACMDGDDARFACEGDLGAAVDVLREYDVMRRRCTSDHGRRINQLRMTASALSVPALCAFVRDRLERGGVPGDVVLGMLRAAYAAMMDAVARIRPGEGALSAAAAVHGGRATITLLDSGPVGDEDASCPPGAEHVDHVHRFRILDRHNALVLETVLGGGRPPG
jgi:hypothetical protein